MVHTPRLISRSTSSTTGSSQPFLSFTTLMLAQNSFSKPNFFAKAYMMVWSAFDSNSGSTTFSRHWIERFEAVQEPDVSNCVAAGSRYTPSLRSGITAEAEG